MEPSENKNEIKEEKKPEPQNQEKKEENVINNNPPQPQPQKEEPPIQTFQLGDERHPVDPDAEEIEYLRCYVNDGEMLYHEGGYDCDQTTITPPSHPEWYYEILNENGTITYQYMYQAGDTIINGKTTAIRTT